MPEGDLASLAFLRGCWRHAERLHTLGELRHSKHCTIGVLPKVPRGALFVYGDVQYDLAWRRAGEAWLGTLRSRSSDPFAEPSDPFAELSITAGKQGLLLRARRESSWLGISKSVPLVGRTAQDSVYFGEALSMRSTTLDGAPVLLVRMAGGLRVFERMPCAR